MDKLKTLREKYPKFVYQNYSWQISKNPHTKTSTVRGKDLEIFFDFKIEPDIYFKPKITIKDINRVQLKPFLKQLDNMVFHLGLIEMISYWKATCSPLIEIKAGFLNAEQIKWWKDLILNGMGQFFYENKINFTKSNFLTIRSAQNAAREAIPSKLARDGFPSKQNRVLVPIGGGKDSIVVLEILKKAQKDINCICLNPTETDKKVIKMGNCDKPIFGKRQIDKKLLELNKKGFLNGHTPISAYFAFFTTLAAAIFGYKYIALGNERSSNEGNVKYLGKIINHQWSKSFEFEEMFKKYSKKYLVKAVKEDKSSFPPSSRKRNSVVEYFSFLRPLYEIQIGKLFSNYPKYFPIFRSCNKGQKTNSWCNNCSKCLFIFSSLYPFLKEKELIKIFGKNLFEDKNLIPIMEQLVGERGFKPFECVGTKKESLAAFYLSWKKHKTNRGRASNKLPVLLWYFEKKILPKHKNLEKESKKILNSWNKQHNLPKEFKKLLNINIECGFNVSY
ncbi:MAG: hypothetical protein ABIG08_01910 [bacterium]